jgi:hypothetical protein
MQSSHIHPDIMHARTWLYLYIVVCVRTILEFYDWLPWNTCIGCTYWFINVILIQRVDMDWIRTEQNRLMQTNKLLTGIFISLHLCQECWRPELARQVNKWLMFVQVQSDWVVVRRVVNIVFNRQSKQVSRNSANIWHDEMVYRTKSNFIKVIWKIYIVFSSKHSITH